MKDIEFGETTYKNITKVSTKINIIGYYTFP